MSATSEQVRPADAGTRTVERALALLSAVCEAGSVSLSDAAKSVELSTSTALRLLRTMESAGYVRRDGEGVYRAGPAIVQLGVLALSNEALISLTRDSMDRLVDATGESAYLSIAASGRRGLYIAIAEGTHSVRHANWVGRTFPLERSAAGRALSGEIAAGESIVVGDGVEPDVTGIAVPLVTHDRVVGALSVVVPSYRITAQRAEEISAALRAEARFIAQV